MSGEDVWRVVGANVYVKAFRVTSMTECSQRYGKISKTKDFFGMVLEFFIKKTSLNCNSFFVLGEYDLGGGTRKRKELSIHSVIKVATHTHYLVGFFTKTQN